MLTPLSLAKKMFPPRVRAALRTARDRAAAAADRAFELAGRKSLKAWRSVHPRVRPEMTLAMLCIRRPVYVDMAICSINSLHYWNPSCRVLLHLDRICFESYQRKNKRVDYAEWVRPILVEESSSTPWQFTKLDVVLAMSSRGVPFVDADSRWHTDPRPLILPDKAMFLVEVNRFAAVESERTLVTDVLRHQDWSAFLHFNTGFISIPAHLATELFAAECRTLAQRIYEFSDEMVLAAAQSRHLKHTCEELALSLAAQAVIGIDRIRTLKGSDGPGDRSLLESYYYGALNQID
jgi:hypothetical protein